MERGDAERDGDGKKRGDGERDGERGEGEGQRETGKARGKKGEQGKPKQGWSGKGQF